MVAVLTVQIAHLMQCKTVDASYWQNVAAALNRRSLNESFGCSRCLRSSAAARDDLKCGDV